MDTAASRHTPKETLVALAQDEDPNVRWRVAGNTNTPTDVLLRLATDPDTDIRIKVAQNPTTPDAVLQALAKNKNVGVSEQALMAIEERAIERRKVDD